MALSKKKRFNNMLQRDVIAFGTASMYVGFSYEFTLVQVSNNKRNVIEKHFFSNIKIAHKQNMMDIYFFLAQNVSHVKNGH